VLGLGCDDRLFNSVIVRPPTQELIKCVSTNPLKHTVDTSLAIKQHEEYVRVLKEEGIEVYVLPELKGFPDAVFIQDTAVVSSVRRAALVCMFGELSRRGEELSVAEFLRGLGFTLYYVSLPATIEGGDVLVTDVGVIYVGLSFRTNLYGIKFLRDFLSNYEVITVPIDKVFHLLSAVNYLGRKRLAIVPELVETSFFQGFKLIRIPLDEAYAANMLYLGCDRVLIPDGYPKTYDRLRKEGFKPIVVDVSEFWKCDGGVTCLNLPLYNI
jgi:dimethylargininase